MPVLQFTVFWRARCHFINGVPFAKDENVQVQCVDMACEEILVGASHRLSSIEVRGFIVGLIQMRCTCDVFRFWHHLSLDSFGIKVSSLRLGPFGARCVLKIFRFW